MRSVLLILCLAFSGYSVIVYYFSEGNHTPPISAEAIEGKKIWQKKNCQSCHQFYGLGGYMGPDLTNITAQKNENYIRAIIQSGTRKMPNFHLTGTEVNSIIAYLSWINASGSAAVPDSAVNSWGSYNIP